MDKPEPALAALTAFTGAIRQKFSTHVEGEPEDQLRAPCEALTASIGAVLGHSVTVVGETLLANHGGKPDFGIAVDKLLCGHIELKAPGKGANPEFYTGHDRKQWEKFKNLPNLIYCDGIEWSLYRYGEPLRHARLRADPRTAKSGLTDSTTVEELLALYRDFLIWDPKPPTSAQQLASFLAPLCRLLRDDVLDALNRGVAPVMTAAADWRRYLFPEVSSEQFADAYAQTITFTLLLARSNGSDTLDLDHAIASLSETSNVLLSRALRVLTDPQVEAHLSSSLKILQRVINAVPTGTMSGGRRDPWLHFYEDFLQEYDPDLRRDAGAYYTPVEVVQAQVRLVDELLTSRFKKRLGFAEGGVNVLDPAVGTGTYLLGVIEHAMSRVLDVEGEGAVAARASVLANSLFGFEMMVGPYSVASLRLTRMLKDYGAGLPGDGVQVMLNNTLESPHQHIPELPLAYRPIGIEHQRAKRIKEAVPIIVCLGNPPYDRHAAATEANRGATGSWVRWGDGNTGTSPILNTFIDPVRAANKGGQLKNLYNLYVYFWRWALWKTFEHELAGGAGVVSFITASSFLDGDAFIGMRQHMRRLCDEIWIIDLGGEGRGTRRDENVFAIQTPVAITMAVRYAGPKPDTMATVHYCRLQGDRIEKLAQLERISSIADLHFSVCPSEPTGPFRPKRQGEYFAWPLLTELMPWQSSGCQIKRTWPICTSKSVLQSRWKSFLLAEDREEAFKATRDRTIDSEVTDLTSATKLQPLRNIASGTPPPPIRRYGYRSFDRQYVLADNRLGDFLRPSLWLASSDWQIFFASLLTKPLGWGAGPDDHLRRAGHGFLFWSRSKGRHPIVSGRRSENTQHTSRAASIPG